MKKLTLLIILIHTTCFANIDAKVVKNLGLNDNYLQTNSFKIAYKELSRPKIISYYNGLLRRAPLSMKITKEMIQSKNLPKEFFFIPLIESSFRNQINKKNGPSGLWQIMPQTARNLNLTVNSSVDERLDLLKASNAATNYLKKYHKKFNKPYLAVMAYNAGEGRIISGLARASLDRYLELHPNEKNSQTVKIYQGYINNYIKNRKGMKNLYKVYGKYRNYFDYSYAVKNNKRDYFPKITVNYINKILVFSILNENNRFSSINQKSRYSIKAIDAPRGKSIKAIAKSISMNSKELVGINEHIRKDIIPKDYKNLKLNIPDTKLDVYNQNIAKIDINNIMNQNKNSSNNIYKVKSGDTLSQIASKNNVSIKKLRFIKRKKQNILSVGDEIEIIK